jgi:hypothetical protein
MATIKVTGYDTVDFHVRLDRIAAEIRPIVHELIESKVQSINGDEMDCLLRIAGDAFTALVHHLVCILDSQLHDFNDLLTDAKVAMEQYQRFHRML